MKMTPQLKDQLHSRGIESFHGPHVNVPPNVILESPCSIKWMSIEHSLSMGAFSYGVSGYYCCVVLGRYCSIGENVQIGRQDHHTSWLSTSPFQYLSTSLFDVGSNFEGGTEFHNYRSHTLGEVEGMQVKTTTISNDVWIGHGAFIKAGITIGTGAIVAAHAVVVKDIPPYAVVAGNPAVIKKFRVDEKKIGALIESRWWDYAPWQLKNVPFHDVDGCIESLKAMRDAGKPTFNATTISLGEIEN